MINRSSVFKAAWKSYRLARLAIWAADDECGRRFLRSLFAKMLRMAWADARKAAALAPAPVASVARIPVTPERAAAIREELRAQEYSDAPTNWHRHRELILELGAAP